MAKKEPTARALAVIGECCGSKCRNCPYQPKHGGPRATLPERLKHLVKARWSGITPGVVTNAPAQLDDVAPTLLTDMAVSPRGMQGRVLTEALQHPTPAAQRARNEETKQTGPLMAALVRQDSYERQQ